MRIAGGVDDVDLQLKPAVMGLLGGDGDLLGAAVVQQGLERLLGVLLCKDAHPWAVFFAAKFVQAGAQRGISPPGCEGSHEADVDGVRQRIDTLARQVASGGVYACVHGDAWCKGTCRECISGRLKV